MSCDTRRWRAPPRAPRFLGAQRCPAHRERRETNRRVGANRGGERHGARRAARHPRQIHLGRVRRERRGNVVEGRERGASHRVQNTRRGRGGKPRRKSNRRHRRPRERRGVRLLRRLLERRAQRRLLRLAHAERAVRDGFELGEIEGEQPLGFPRAATRGADWKNQTAKRQTLRRPRRRRRGGDFSRGRDVTPWKTNRLDRARRTAHHVRERVDEGGGVRGRRANRDDAGESREIRRGPLVARLRRHRRQRGRRKRGEKRIRRAQKTRQRVDGGGWVPGAVRRDSRRRRRQRRGERRAVVERRRVSARFVHERDDDATGVSRRRYLSLHPRVVPRGVRREYHERPRVFRATRRGVHALGSRHREISRGVEGGANLLGDKRLLLGRAHKRAGREVERAEVRRRGGGGGGGGGCLRLGDFASRAFRVGYRFRRRRAFAFDVGGGGGERFASRRRQRGIRRRRLRRRARADASPAGRGGRRSFLSVQSGGVRVRSEGVRVRSDASRLGRGGGGG